MITQSDDWQITLTVATLILAIVAIATFVLNYLILRKQLKTSQQSASILEMDIKNRLRPIIQIVDVRPYSVTLENNDILSWENYTQANPKPIPIRVSFRGEIKNLGAVAALQVRAKWLQGLVEITRDSLEHGIEDPSFPLGLNLLIFRVFIQF